MTANQPARNFKGQLSSVQLWSRARTQAEIRADMSTRRAPRTRAWWVTGRLMAALRIGRLASGMRRSKGNPRAWCQGPEHRQELPRRAVRCPGLGLRGGADEIKATMHLSLSGKGTGTCCLLSFGAIVYEEGSVSAPDFSTHSNSGIVYGDPYAGARRLSRVTGSGLKVVKYGSDELVAVSQRGVYEESFEFKVTTSDASFVPTAPTDWATSCLPFRTSARARAAA